MKEETRKKKLERRKKKEERRKKKEERRKKKEERKPKAERRHCPAFAFPLYCLHDLDAGDTEMNEQRALELLKKGLTTGQVASVIGVSPGRISQFLQKEEVKQALEVARAESDTKDIEEVQIQAKTVAVKNVILDALAKRTDEASYMDLARALEMISRAESIKQNPIPLSGGPIFNHAQVVITMPDRVIQQEIQITQDREVIAIGNRALAPMPASRVTKLFEEMKNERASLPAESKESSATVI